ncbi:MAG: hypothetical protein K0S45_1154 [Nitrospira sp.]|jgi:hypothetical protein|nr:hypothetical protein [Nitrospira sp.]
MLWPVIQHADQISTGALPTQQAGIYPLQLFDETSQSKDAFSRKGYAPLLPNQPEISSHDTSIARLAIFESHARLRFLHATRFPLQVEHRSCGLRDPIDTKQRRKAILYLRPFRIHWPLSASRNLDQRNNCSFNRH